MVIKLSTDLLQQIFMFLNTVILVLSSILCTKPKLDKCILSPRDKCSDVGLYRLFYCLLSLELSKTLRSVSLRKSVCQSDNHSVNPVSLSLSRSRSVSQSVSQRVSGLSVSRAGRQTDSDSVK